MKKASKQKLITHVSARPILTLTRRNLLPQTHRLLGNLVAVMLIKLLLFIPLLGDIKLEEKYIKHQKKLTKQGNPIKKVKILIKMSGVNLKLVSRVIKRGKFPEANTILSRYVKNVKQARQILYKSGRNAQKKPAGFKHLEISLRKQLRKLNDIKIHYPFDEQVSVDKTIKYVEDVKGEIMNTIFGADNIIYE